LIAFRVDALPTLVPMKVMLLVGIGGAIGAVARYRLGEWIGGQTDSRFPFGTFVVNVVGCLIAGLLAGLAARTGALSDDARLFLFTGLLGGFTTFSAFGLETVSLLRRGDATTAAVYVVLSVLCGVFALWAVYATLAPAGR